MKNHFVALTLLGILLTGLGRVAGEGITPEQVKEAQTLIGQFRSPEFAVRQTAVEELVKMGPGVLPLIRKTLAETKDDEVKLRCEMVMREIGIRETDKVVDTVISGLKQHFTRLKAVDLTYTEDLTRSPAPKDSNQTSPGFRYPQCTVCRLQMEGEKYRSETGLEGSTAHETLGKDVSYDIKAFDGERYQIFNKKSLELWVSRRRTPFSPFFNLPILLPFYFVPGEEKTFAAFRSKATWDELKKSATIGPAVKVQGYDCISLDVHVSGSPRHYRVYCARDLDYYPVRYEVSGASGFKAEEVVVKEMKEYATAEGRVVVPLKVEVTWRSPGNEKVVRFEYSIRNEGLSVNEDIPDEVFTIPRSMARKYQEDKE